MSGSRRSGRRPGDADTRGGIAAAAARLFAERGYERTTFRAVAAAAGVDPALVVHYFGSKEGLLLEAVRLPAEAEAVLTTVPGGDLAGVGRRLAELLVGLLEDPELRVRVVGMIRAAASEPAAAQAVRQLVETERLGPLAAGLDVPDAPLRASLVGSQIVGLVMARYVVGVEPLASAPPAVVVDALAPTLQRYLTEPLD